VQPLRKSPIFTPYVVIWTMFGVLSLGYLSILSLAPEWLDDLRPASSMTDPQSNRGQRAAARLAADVGSLRDSVAQIQLDLAKVRTEVAGQSERNSSHAAQIAALEQKLNSATGATTAASAPSADPAVASAIIPESIATGEILTSNEVMAGSTSAAQPVPPQTASAPAETAPKTPPLTTQGSAQLPTVINGDMLLAVPLETGSVAPAGQAKADVISFGPAIVKPAPKVLGLRISSGASIDSLRLSWSLLSDRHADTLKTMQPRYTASGDAANPNYDLVAGPVKSKAEALKLCKALAAKNVPCKIGEFTGEAL
jgi:hypothetical protein